MKVSFKNQFLTLLFSIITLQLFSQRPNIVVIMVDDLGYADMKFNNGASDIQTPNLDALAANGTICSSGYVVHPFCGPSRAGLMTGRYPHTIGSQFNIPGQNSSNGNAGLDLDIGVPTSETFFSKVLQDADYYTGVIGKWHLGKGTAYYPNSRGFDEFYGMPGGGHNYFPTQYKAQYQNNVNNNTQFIWDYVTPLERNGVAVDNENGRYLTDVLSDEAVDFVNTAAAKTDPFFLFLSYNAPHTPLEAKAEDLALFSSISDADRREYVAMVYAVDRGVKKVVDALKAKNEFDNTLIVFLSDNGGRTDRGASNSPLRGAKGSTYEGGYRVPMFFHWPNVVPANRVYEHPVSSLDLYPTFSKLANATIPSGKKLDGLDIWSDFIAGTNPDENRLIYALRHQGSSSDVGARKGDWKAVRISNDSPWKLFNMTNDIAENNDVSDANPQILTDIINQTKTWADTHTTPLFFDSQIRIDNWNNNNMPKFNDTFDSRYVNNAEFYPLSDQQNNGNWTLNTEISDEFEASSIDEDKWLIQGRNGEYQSNFIGRSPSQFSTENAIQDNGKLKILTKWDPNYNFTNDNSGNPLGVYNGQSMPITTAAVISKKQFKYGYMEIKSKAANAEITSSFWTTGPGRGLPGASEVDMFEQFGGHKSNDSWRKRLKFNLISWDPNNSIKQAATAAGQAVGTAHTRNIQADNNTADDFHVYGFEWTETFIKVYIDGVLHPEGTILKSELTDNGNDPDRWVTDVPYWVWFDSETFPWLGLPDASDLTTPAEYQIEYIRIWETKENTTATATTLSAGDAAIVGYKADAGNIGELSYVILKNIEPGTTISFSNRGWHKNGSFNEGGSGPYGIDDVFSWTAAEAHVSGTIFKLGRNGHVTTVINGAETAVGTTTQTFGSDGDWDLSPVGDSVLMYNGDSSAHPSDSSSLWITGLNTNGVDNGGNLQRAGWTVGGGNAYCELPSALENFNIDVTGGDINLNLWDINHGVYTGGASGSPTTIRASINNYANWTLNESNQFNLWDNEISVNGNTGNIILGDVTLSTPSNILSTLKMYQPSKSVLKITGLNTGKSTISIINVFGKTVLTSSFQTSNGITEIQLPNITSGIYFIQVNNKEGKLNMKILIE